MMIMTHWFSHADSQLHRIKADVAGMEVEAGGEDKVMINNGSPFQNIHLWTLPAYSPLDHSRITEIKHLYCFRRVPRLKDEMPNFQIIMKTSELMYSQSWVSESEYSLWEPEASTNIDIKFSLGDSWLQLWQHLEVYMIDRQTKNSVTVIRKTNI